QAGRWLCGALRDVFVAQQAEHDVAAMELEAGSLEVLDGEACTLEGLGGGIAEDVQPATAVEVGEERAAQVMGGLRIESGSARGAGFAEAQSGLLGSQVAQQTQLHFVRGAGEFRMIFESGALEILNRPTGFLDLFGCRIAEQVQTTPGIEEALEAKAHRMSGLG